MKFIESKRIIEGVINEDFENNEKLESLLNFFEYYADDYNQEFNGILDTICSELCAITKKMDHFLFMYFDNKVNFDACHHRTLLNFQDRLFNDVFEASQIFYHLNTFIESKIYRNLSTPPSLLSKIYCYQQQSAFTISETRKIMEEDLQPFLYKNTYKSITNNINNEC